MLVLAPELPWPATNGYLAKLAGFLSHVSMDWDLIYGTDGVGSALAPAIPRAGALIPVRVRGFRRLRAVRGGVLPSNARLPWAAVRPHVERLLKNSSAYEVVHLDTFSMAHLAKPVSRLLGQLACPVTLVCSPNDSYSLLLSSHRTMKRRVQSRIVLSFESRFYRTADFVDVVSDRDVAWLRNEVTDTEVRLIPLGVDVRSFDGPRPEPSWDILYVGGTAGVEAWIRTLISVVASSVRTDFPGLRVAMAGPTPPGWLLQLCSDNGWIHLGFVDRLPELLRSARMLVVPSAQVAGTPTKALEAMAAGTPVVGMQALDGVVNGADGVSYSRAASWEELAVRMRMVLSDDAYAKRIGHGGRALVEKEHDWPTVVTKYLSFRSFPNVH